MAHRPHRVLVVVLLSLAFVTGLIGMFAVWVNRQALNTYNWTETSGKLLENKNVQTALSAYLVDQLFTNVDVAGELQKVLPPQASALAGPAARAGWSRSGPGPRLRRCFRPGHVALPAFDCQPARADGVPDSGGLIQVA